MAAISEVGDLRFQARGWVSGSDCGCLGLEDFFFLLLFFNLPLNKRSDLFSYRFGLNNIFFLARRSV
jgi:hypothetical protein